MKTKKLVSGLALLIFLCSACARDGKDGADGADGNENVQTYILNISEATEFDVSVSLPLPELTQDVIDNDLVVTYVKFFNDPLLYTLPRGTMAAGSVPDTYSISVGLDPSRVILFFRDQGGSEVSILSDQLEFVKVVLAQSSNTETRTVTGNL